MLRQRSHRPFGMLLAFVAAVTLAFSTASSASGGIGFYGIVEKVVFEPNDTSPERVQVWGAFAYVDGGADSTGAVSTARRGYLYFRLPDRLSTYSGQVEAARREWNDLKSVAGSGQAVGFGSWGYIGVFAPAGPSYIYESQPNRGVQTDLRVRVASEPPASPSIYQTNIGVVKIPADGSRREIVDELRRQLKNP